MFNIQSMNAGKDEGWMDEWIDMQAFKFIFCALRSLLFFNADERTFPGDVMPVVDVNLI